MNTTRVLILYIVCLIIGQTIAVGLGLLADKHSNATGIAVFIPVYYATYWAAWRVALFIGDREPAVAAEASRDTRSPLSVAVAMLAPAALTLELAD